MTSLQAGHQYSLSTEDKNNKSVIFVKLTDSAIQSIEQLLNSKKGSLLKPTIQFQDNTGIISLPQNGRKNNYKFTLSNIEGGGLQSGFQCLHHIDNSSLESMGFMFTKMQIHATEDSYEKTKCKMTAADQEQKNLCTKEIRQTASRLGSKVCVKRPGLMYNLEKPLSSIVKPEPAKFNSKSKVNNHATLIQQPIRERIIHILAAKPYKKAELLLRLKREGVSDKDKDKINNILVEVAKLKGNTFILENQIWNEIREDWEFSSVEELDLIKKKKQQFMKSKNVNGATELSKPSVKQVVNGASELSKPSVKQVVNGASELSKPSVKQMNGNSSSRCLSVLDKIKLCQQLLNGNTSSSDKNIVENGNKNNDNTSEMLLAPESAPVFDFSEIQLKYPKIESSKQRSQYVKDFNDEYEEYSKLQAEMKEVSEKFSSLFDSLKVSIEGSPEHNGIKIQIAQEYKKSRKNSYISSRKKFEFLRAKLSHIREVILEYDKDKNAQF